MVWTTLYQERVEALQAVALGSRPGAIADSGSPTASKASPGFAYSCILIPWDVSNLGWPDQQIYHGAEGAMQVIRF